VGGIEQHHPEQIDARRGGMHRSAKAQRRGARQQAGMVEVGVREQDEVEPAQVEGRAPRRLRRQASRPPWNRPQSTRKRTSPVSTRKQEPVTSPAAPRKCDTHGPFSAGNGGIMLDLRQSLLGCAFYNEFITLEGDMFKHILVPTDGSALSTDTVKKAVDFAREIGAKITFFYAKPDYPWPSTARAP
jgi:hypothetical protein